MARSAFAASPHPNPHAGEGIVNNPPSLAGEGGAQAAGVGGWGVPSGAAVVDLLVIGGGINGVGIARDAAGRGLSVLLCEKGDLAGGTSSASSKLIHGGLRYLEHGAFRLVRE